MTELHKRLKQKGLSQEISSRWKGLSNERRIAEKNDKVKPTFLRAKDIAGKYDTKKALLTTLGGNLRVITSDDLKAFSQNIKTLKEHYSAGISPTQVIDLSLPIDIKRANEQIKYAIPRSRKNDVIHFITNASGENKAKYHFVNVQVMGFLTLKFTPEEISLKNVQKMAKNGGVKFECDCGRYQYWYRYLNSVAGTNFGRQETGFPKIRNPNLVGVACKHILRVMQWIKSSQGVHYLQKELEKSRNKDIERKNTLKKSEVEQHLAKQLMNRDIKIASNDKRAKVLKKMHTQTKRMSREIDKNRKKQLRQSEIQKSINEAIKLLQQHGYTVDKS